MLKLSLKSYLVLVTLCLSSGIITSYAMAPTHWIFCLFLGFSLFYYCFENCASALKAFGLGYAFAFGYHLLGLSWIGNALLVEGNPYQWAWPLAVMGLPIILAFFSAILCAIAKIISLKKPILSFPAFILCIGLGEWVRGHAFTGFPWNLYAYAWGDMLEILQTTYLTGSYGLTFMTIFWASIIGFCAQNYTLKTKIITATIALITLSASYIYGVQRLHNTPTQFHDDIQVAVVQPNIAQHEKWESSLIRDHFQKHLNLSASISPQSKTLLIWPETAIPPYFLNDQSAFQAIQSILESYPPHSYLIAGALRVDESPEQKTYFNSIITVNTDPAITHVYDKNHLVPFGEYIPFQDYIPLTPITQFSGFERGPGLETVYLQDHQGFSPLICYEVIFPGKTALPDAQFVINVTNDAWYGDSAGPHQHFLQSRIRAIETGIPVLRSANTGISGIIDPLGRIIAKSDLFQDKIILQFLPKPLKR